MDESTPQSNPSSSPDDAYGQADIDALFGDAGSASPPSADIGISQADIDALMRSADDSPSAAEAAGDAGLPPSGTGDPPGESVLSTANAPPSPAATAQTIPSSNTDAPPRLDTLGRPFDEAAAAMQAAIEEERIAARSMKAAAPAPPVIGVPLELHELLVPSGVDVDAKRVSMLNDVNLRVIVELGRTRMYVEEVLKLGEGSVVELDKLAGDPVDVFINERLVARGEVLVLNDSFCVRINEVLSHDPHRVSA